MATTTSSSPTAMYTSTATPTVPLELAGLINMVHGDRIAPDLFYPEPVTSYSFEPTATKQVHSINQIPASTSIPHSTPSFTPSLQSYVPPPPSTGPWYEQAWIGPATWLLIIYCIISAIVCAMLLLSGAMDWRLNLYTPRPIGGLARQSSRRLSRPTSNDTRMRQMSRAERRQARRYRDSVETELGDPDQEQADREFEEREIESIRRQWEMHGVHFTNEQLRAQQQAYYVSARAARITDRNRSDAIVRENMRAMGLIA